MLKVLRKTRVSLSSKMIDIFGFKTRKKEFLNQKIRIASCAKLCVDSSKHFIQILQLSLRTLKKRKTITILSGQKLVPVVSLSLPSPPDVKPGTIELKKPKSKDLNQGPCPTKSKFLPKNVVATIKLYRTFVEGFGNFYHDFVLYLKVLRIVHNSPEGLRALNIKELELYMKMPKDIVKVAPSLIGTSLPVIGYVVFLLVFTCPRQLLSSHFWTPNQYDEVQKQELQKRFVHSPTIISQLQMKLQGINEPFKYDALAQVLKAVRCGSFPTKRELMLVKELFADPPFSLESLSKKDINLLSGMHGLSGLFSKRTKLKKHAFLIQHMDLAIRREGGVHNMSNEILKRACVIRGLYPVNMTKTDIVLWLRNWTEVSMSIQDQHLSLLLHLPIFLGFNHPNNWQLYARSKKGYRTMFNRKWKNCVL